MYKKIKLKLIKTLTWPIKIKNTEKKLPKNLNIG